MAVSKSTEAAVTDEIKAAEVAASSEVKTVEQDVAKAQATADAAKGIVAEVEDVVRHEWIVVRDFVSHVKTQLLTFTKGDVLTHEVGSELASHGAPVKPAK